MNVSLKLTKEDAEKEIKAATQPNGGLYMNDGYAYLEWDGRQLEALLDGHFTAAELRAIADHMDKRKPPEDK